jgi:streptogramin lyase
VTFYCPQQQGASTIGPIFLLPLAQTPAPDGMLEAPDGSVYLTDLEHNGIVRWNAASKKIEPVIADKPLLWPDTLSWGPNGDLYVTASQIENMPRFNNGKSIRTEPYKLWNNRDRKIRVTAANR